MILAIKNIFHNESEEESLNLITQKNALLLKEPKMKYRNVKIYKRPDSNTYYARPTINHKQIYISGRTARDVYNKLRKIYIQPTPSKKSSNNTYTLNQWIDQWYKLYKVNIVGEKQIKDILSHRKNYFTTPMFNDPINEVKSLDILELLNSIKFERTKLKVYTFLTDIFNKAYLNNLITVNPMKIIKKPKYQAKEKRLLTPEEETSFIKECLIHPYGYIYLISLYQGLIPAESRSLLKSDIDLTKNTIRIRGTKNQYRDRTMPLFDNTKNILSLIKSDSDLVYPLSKEKQRKIFNDILAKLNIKDFTQHNLRHMFITKCKNLNVPEHIVQSWCGHSIGSSVTSKVYTHKDSITENQYINILNSEKPC